jgi:glycosyltransferase involved in cell wall biosynthesis
MIGQKGIPATYGGVERHVEELSARLARLEHEVTAYCRPYYTNVRGTHRGVALRILPSIPTRHLDTLTHTALCSIDSICRRYDVVHFHSIGPALLAFAPRLLRRCAVVVTVHALDWRRRKWGPFARWWLRRGEWAAAHVPHRTIVVSRSMADYFRAKGDEVAYIPNGVPEPHREPIQELSRFGLADGEFVLWLGRFVPEKRVEDLVEAFRALPTQKKLVLAGELDESDAYVQRVKAAGAGDSRVVFPGGLYGRAKAEALTHARLVVLPSEMEGFPIALLEAMRYGRPVLASDIPENLEAVSPGRNGFVFKTGDATSLRLEMEQILQDPERAAAAGRAAEEDARRYDWDSIALQTEALYQSALAEVRKAARG